MQVDFKILNLPLEKKNTIKRMRIQAIDGERIFTSQKDWIKELIFRIYAEKSSKLNDKKKQIIFNLAKKFGF